MEFNSWLSFSVVVTEKLTNSQSSDVWFNVIDRSRYKLTSSYWQPVHDSQTNYTKQHQPLKTGMKLNDSFFHHNRAVRPGSTTPNCWHQSFLSQQRLILYLLWLESRFTSSNVFKTSLHLLLRLTHFFAIKQMLQAANCSSSSSEDEPAVTPWTDRYFTLTASVLDVEKQVRWRHFYIWLFFFTVFTSDWLLLRLFSLLFLIL